MTANVENDLQQVTLFLASSAAPGNRKIPRPWNLPYVLRGSIDGTVGNKKKTGRLASSTDEQLTSLTVPIRSNKSPLLLGQPPHIFDQVIKSLADKTPKKTHIFPQYLLSSPLISSKLLFNTGSNGNCRPCNELDCWDRSTMKRKENWKNCHLRSGYGQGCRASVKRMEVPLLTWPASQA